MPTEADTCRTYIVPKLHGSGWEDEYVAEQMVLMCGRIVPIGDGQAKVNAFLLASLGDDVRELQVKGGEELRPFFGRTLMASVLDRAFKGEL